MIKKVKKISNKIRGTNMSTKTNAKSIMKLEEGDELNLDFGKIAKVAAKCPDVIPVAVQNADTGEVILVAYVNEPALKHTIKTGIATFWSTSRNELWIKGQESGALYDIVDVFVNCEQNSLLYRVRPRRGGICHTKNKSGQARNCYYRRLNFKTGKLENVNP
jgi:phosphoribosyl-AMP cyclohydrolase